jgi:hypothetical protein
MALVLALMALMILTVVGLTLAASTSTEVQVAANFRWSALALYNAEAGLNVAKTVIAANMDASGDFASLVPARATTWPFGTTPTAAAELDDFTPAGTRSFENWQCDRRGNGMGNGLIVPNGTGSLENVQKWGTPEQILNGSFTAWMRRPVVVDTVNVATLGQLKDYSKDTAVGGGNYPKGDAVILLAEGVAPAVALAGNRAVQYIEVTAYPYMAESAVPPCSSLAPQAGSGPGNHNVACLGVNWGDVTIGGAPPPGVPAGTALK